MSDFIVNSGLDPKEISIVNEETILINRNPKKYKLLKLTNQKYLLKVDNNFYEASIISNKENDFEVFIDQDYLTVKVLTALQAKALKLIQNSTKDGLQQTIVKSPMPGMVLKVKKKVGDSVNKGEAVLVLEAMKMENEIKSPVNGILAEINVAPGKAIEKNIILFSIK